MDDAPPEAALWPVEMPQSSEIARLMGADEAYPLAELAHKTKNAVTIAVQDRPGQKHTQPAKTLAK